VSPLFDAYVMVDWSAASVPRTGADSVWICVLERQDDGLAPPRLVNPETRPAGIAILADVLSDLVARDRVTLVGFDFAFGFPAGFAGSLRHDAPDWSHVWKEIHARIDDRGDNRNNRFAVAAELNRRVSGNAFPFWGCPPPQRSAHLAATRPGNYGPGTLAEYRITDRRAKGPQPVWKLAYAGSVGSQSLVGIAHVFRLRHHPWIEEVTRIWPFETGLRPLARADANGWRVLLAEVYPSMVPVCAEAGEVKDRAQVRTLARHFAELDGQGRLAALFAGPDGLTAEERLAIEREEGWILGIEAAATPPSPTASRYHYLRDPEEIYRQSFARIRADPGLASVRPDLQPLAIRLVHACGMPDIVSDLTASAGATAKGRQALHRGAVILVDSKMVAAGIIGDRLAAANLVVCTLGDPQVPGIAGRRSTTRSAAAVDLWRPHLAGAIVAIGNAPTALFRLLELLDEGLAPPALVLAFPVGFIGAAEAKEALIAHPSAVPFVTLRGRRGGSAFAAAAVNALAEES
jgi:precorrin-8X/cobalt-precorrin-8 methylmutase